jgi:hypothetical protein
MNYKVFVVVFISLIMFVGVTIVGSSMVARSQAFAFSGVLFALLVNLDSP